MARKTQLELGVVNGVNVINRVENKRGNVMVECKCICGKMFVTRFTDIVRGNQKSCGCMQRKKHGMKGTRFYTIWCAVKNRCNCKTFVHYKYYGGKGVKNTRVEFNSFMEDMYDSYIKHTLEYGVKQTTIDRIDSNGNYELSNCRRATIVEQANNRSSNNSSSLPKPKVPGK